MTARTAAGEPVPVRPPKTIQSALLVLEEVARRGPGVTAQEISQALGIPRATAYRLVNVLVESAYLDRMPGLRGFTLGRRALELAHLLAPSKAPTAATEVVAGLRSSIRGGVHLVRYEGERLTVIDADPDFPLSDEVRIARELGASAMGRLLLAELASRREHPAAGELPTAFLTGLVHQVTEAGYATQVDQLTAGFGCIAVPIRERTGRLIGSLALSVRSERVREPEQLVGVLRAGAQRLAPLLA